LTSSEDFSVPLDPQGHQDSLEVVFVWIPMEKLGEFYLENLGGPEGEGRFLTGPETEDPDDTEITLRRLQCQEGSRGGQNQMWRFKDGFLECVGSKKVLDIDWNFAGTNEYSGDGAPVLAWHEKHGGNNQKFYFLRMMRGEEEWLLIGRSADMEEGFDQTRTFLTFDDDKGMMTSGCLESHCPEQRWRIVREQQPYWWETMYPKGPYPSNALVAGRDDSYDVYIALVEVEKGVQVIGKVHNNNCYVAYDDGEKWISDDKFKILCVHPKAQVEWVLVESYCSVPQNTVKAPPVFGKDEYIGRGPVRADNLTPGRLIEGENHLLASWGEECHQLSVYEALVITM